MGKLKFFSIFLFAALVFTPVVWADQVRTSVTVLDPENPQVLGAQTDEQQAKCASDFNGMDGVDFVDFQIFGQLYKQEVISCQLDLVGNNCFVDEADLQVFVSEYNSPTCL